MTRSAGNPLGYDYRSPAHVARHEWLVIGNPDGSTEGQDPRDVPIELLGNLPGPLAAIEAKCIDCCAGSRSEVAKCTAIGCAHSYRVSQPGARMIKGLRITCAGIGIDGPRAAHVACLAVLAALLLAATGAGAESAVDEGVRAQMLKRRDGPIAHVETQYNDLFIAKSGPLMVLSTRFKANFNIHSSINLTDPDDLPVPYTQLMTAGLLYPEVTKRILMIGLGAGSVSTYLARAMPDAQIDVV